MISSFEVYLKMWFQWSFRKEKFVNMCHNKIFRFRIRNNWNGNCQNSQESGDNTNFQKTRWFCFRDFHRAQKWWRSQNHLNLKKFNDFLKFKHCKLESIYDALDLVTENCHFGFGDLKKVYYSIPINSF